MPDVDTLGYELKFDLDAATVGAESYAAEATGTFVATRKLTELELDFAATVVSMTKLMGKGEAAARRELMELHGDAVEIDV